MTTSALTTPPIVEEEVEEEELEEEEDLSEESLTELKENEKYDIVLFEYPFQDFSLPVCVHVCKTVAGIVQMQGNVSFRDTRHLAGKLL